jgi:hypothetical protein
MWLTRTIYRSHTSKPEMQLLPQAPRSNKSRPINSSSSCTSVSNRPRRPAETLELTFQHPIIGGVYPPLTRSRYLLLRAQSFQWRRRVTTWRRPSRTTQQPHRLYLDGRTTKNLKHSLLFKDCMIQSRLAHRRRISTQIFCAARDVNCFPCVTRTQLCT